MRAQAALGAGEFSVPAASPGRSRTALVIASLLALGLLSVLLARGQYVRVASLYDFAAFYCAGGVVAAHGDPYLAEPLRSCWNATRGFAPGYGVPFAVPAPLPGYALAPFALLSRIPFPLAGAIWVALLLGSFMLTVSLLRRLCGWRTETIFAVLLLGAGARSIFHGQLVPIVYAATVATAYFVVRGRDRAAALAAALTLFEPHLGVPVCLALFIARPRSRALLAACGAGLALISVALLGIGGNIEYFRDVLPAHALSEISNQEQYSLTYLAHLAGAGERAASGLGTLSYIVMLGAGIVAGRMAAAKTGRPALLVLVPPALAVLGGPFVHVQQLAIALPAALVLSDARTRDARWCALAAFLLAVPFGALSLLELNLPLVAGVAFVLALDLFKLPAARAALVSAAVVGVLVVLLNTLAAPVIPTLGPLDPRDGKALAEVSWGAYMAASFHANAVQYNLAKVPGWCGLLLIALVAFRAGGSAARSESARC